MKNYLNSNYNRIGNSEQLQHHKSFQQSAKNILQGYNPNQYPQNNEQLAQEIFGQNPYNKVQVNPNQNSNNSENVTNIIQLQNEIAYQMQAQSRYVQQMKNCPIQSKQYANLRNLQLKSQNIQHELQEILDNIPNNIRYNHEKKNGQFIYQQYQNEIQQYNYEPQTGFNMHLDFIYPVASNFRQLQLYYGVCQLDQNFVIDDFSNPAIQKDLTYNRKVILAEKEYIMDLEQDQDTYLYFEIHMYQEQDLIQNQEPLVLWTLVNLFADFNELMQGKFRLPLYEQNEENDPRQLIKDGLQNYNNMAMNIRLCVPNQKDLDFDYQYLKAEDYLVPEVHIQQLKELASQFKEQRKEFYESVMDTQYNNNPYINIQNQMNGSQYRNTNYSDFSQKRKTVNFNLPDSTQMLDEENQIYTNIVTENEQRTQQDTYDNENEFMSSSQAKYEFQGNSSIKKQKQNQQEEEEEEEEEEDLQGINVGNLIKRKKRMEYDRPWMDYIYKNKANKHKEQDINLDDLYFGEPQNNNPQQQYYDQNIDQKQSDQQESQQQIQQNENVNTENDQINEDNNKNIQENQGEQKQQNTDQNMEKSKKLNNVQKVKIRTVANINERQKISKQERDKVREKRKENLIKQKALAPQKKDYRMEKYLLQQKQEKLQDEYQHIIEAEYSALEYENQLKKQQRKQKMDSYKDKIQKINSRLGGYKKKQSYILSKTEKPKLDNTKKLIIDLQTVQFNKKQENILNEKFEYLIGIFIDNKIITDIYGFEYKFKGLLEINKENSSETHIEINHQDVFEFTELQYKKIKNYWKTNLVIEIQKIDQEILQYEEELQDRNETLFLFQKPLFDNKKNFILQQGQQQEKNTNNQYILSYKIDYDIPIYEKIKYNKEDQLELEIQSIENYKELGDIQLHIQITSNKGIVLDEQKQPCIFNDTQNVYKSNDKNIVPINKNTKVNMSLERLKDQYLSNIKSLRILIILLKHDKSKAEDTKFAWYSHDLIQQKEGEQELQIYEGNFQKNIYELPVLNPPIQEKMVKKLNRTLNFNIKYTTTQKKQTEQQLQKD